MMQLSNIVTDLGFLCELFLQLFDQFLFLHQCILPRLDDAVQTHQCWRQILVLLPFSLQLLLNLFHLLRVDKNKLLTEVQCWPQVSLYFYTEQLQLSWWKPWWLHYSSIMSLNQLLQNSDQWQQNSRRGCQALVPLQLSIMKMKPIDD